MVFYYYSSSGLYSFVIDWPAADVTEKGEERGDDMQQSLARVTIKPHVALALSICLLISVVTGRCHNMLCYYFYIYMTLSTVYNQLLVIRALSSKLSDFVK